MQRRPGRLQYVNTWTFIRVYIDTDRSSATGFRTGRIGANFLIENGNLYRYAGGSGTTYDWWVDRADMKGPGNSGMFFNQSGARVLYSGNTGAPTSATPVSLDKVRP